MDSSELTIRFAGPQNRREFTRPWTAQTLQELADELLPEHGGYTAVVNGSILPKDQWSRPIIQGSEIDFVPDFGDIVGLVIWIATAIGAPAATTAIVGPLTWGMVYSAIAYLGTAYLINSLMPKPKTPDAMGGGSPAYGWDPKTTQEEGRPIPRPYGTFRAHGNIISAYTEPSEDGRKQLMYALVAFGEDPVESVTGVRIGGRPYTDYAGCTCETKRGLLTQTNVSFFDKTRLQFRINQKITQSAGAWTWTTPDDDFDDIEIDMRFNLWYRHKSGSAGGCIVRIIIEIAVADSGSWTEIVDENIDDHLTDLKWKKYTVSDYYAITRGTRYDLRFTKVSSDVDMDRYQNEVYVESVKEVIDVAFTYPGLILVGLAGVASEDLPGFMDVSALIGNRIVDRYDGEAWSLVASNNPAWTFWNIFTQPVISGDGDGTAYAIEEYEGCLPARIDRDDVYALAQFCDTLVPDAEGADEKRITFNGIFDTESNTWTAALQVCQVSRCLPLWEGNKIILAINKAKTRAGVLSVGNILEGSFEEVFAPKIDAASEIEAIFNDRERNYDRRVLPFVNRNLTHYQNKLTMDLIGLTKQTEIVRTIKHRLAHNELCRRGLKVSADIDALRFRVGDLAGIQHDVPDWNELGTRGGGRLYGFTPGVTDDVVILDKDVEDYILAGVTYELMVRVRNTDTATIKTVKSVDGRNVMIDGKFTGTLPRNNDLWAMGKENQVLKDFTIEAIERSGDQQYKLTVLEYNAAVYDKDDEIPVVQVPAPTPAKVDRRFPGNVTVQDLRRQAVAAALEFPSVDIPLTENLRWIDNTPASGYISWALEGGLVGHWKLNDKAANTTVADSSANANDGTLQGGDNTEDKSVAGKTGFAFDFNGLDDSVQISDSAALSPRSEVSVSCWVDFDTLGEVTGIVWKAEYNYVLEQSGDSIYFNVWDSDGNQSSASFAEADLAAGWNHIVGTFGSGVTKIYLNGVLKDTGTVIADIRDNTGDLYIGERPDEIGNQYFDGKIDNVMVFCTRLSVDDVLALYNGGAGTESATSETEILIHVDGQPHIITPGNTNKKFVYWDPNVPTAFQATDVQSEAIGQGRYLICFNDSGIAKESFARHIIHAGILQAKTITAALGQIDDLAVNTLQVADNAITVPVSAFTAGSINCAVGSDTTVQSLSFTTTGGTLFLNWSLNLTIGATYSQLQIKLFRDAVEIYNSGTSKSVQINAPLAGSIEDAPGADTYTYYLKVRIMDGGAYSATNRFLYIHELKK